MSPCLVTFIAGERGPETFQATSLLLRCARELRSIHYHLPAEKGVGILSVPNLKFIGGGTGVVKQLHGSLQGHRKPGALGDLRQFSGL